MSPFVPVAPAVAGVFWVAMFSVSPERVTLTKVGDPLVVTDWFRSYPSTLSAFRFVTRVVDVIENGAVPLAKVEMICLFVVNVPSAESDHPSVPEISPVLSLRLLELK